MKTIQVQTDRGACGQNHLGVNKPFKDEVGTKKFNPANFFKYHFVISLQAREKPYTGKHLPNG